MISWNCDPFFHPPSCTTFHPTFHFPFAVYLSLSLSLSCERPICHLPFAEMLGPSADPFHLNFSFFINQLLILSLSALSLRSRSLSHCLSLSLSLSIPCPRNQTAEGKLFARFLVQDLCERKSDAFLPLARLVECKLCTLVTFTPPQMSGWFVLLSRFTVVLFFFYFFAPYGWRFTVFHLHSGRAAFWFLLFLLLCWYFISFKIILLFTEPRLTTFAVLCDISASSTFVQLLRVLIFRSFLHFFVSCVLRHLHSLLYFLYIINVCTYYLALYLHQRAHCCTFVKDNFAPVFFCFALFSSPVQCLSFFPFFEMCCSIFTILLLIKY